MPPFTRLSRRLTTAAATLLTAVLAVTTLGAAPAHAGNVATPGNFTGYGFDQCLAPNQRAMDAWLNHSPFWAVGIYISGDSRACPNQPNLTPTWISTQLQKGWRLLPITLGPQAWCTTRDRYLQQVRINPNPGNRYGKARRQGRQEAVKTVARAQQLGLANGSTLWYDLEAFDIRPTHCRESALSFLSAWTNKLHKLDYVSGVYSSAASGVTMLDDAMTNRPGRYAMPDQIWIADWNGRADTHSDYVRPTSWSDHQRVHQYRGGHNETWGGVTINIDSNFLDLGNGSVARRAVTMCGGTTVDFPAYPKQRIGDRGPLVQAGQCLLRRAGAYDGPVDGLFDDATRQAVRDYRASVGLRVGGRLTPRTWTTLLVRGNGYPLMKYGSASRGVRRLQRALNAADGARLPLDGVFEGRLTAAVKTYQGDHGLPRTGVVTESVWRLLRAGVR